MEDQITIRIKESAKVYFTSASSLESLEDTNLEIKGTLDRQLPKGMFASVLESTIISTSNAM